MAAFAFSDLGNEVFERAEREGKPIVVLLTVPWCQHCRELRDTSFSDPRVRQRLERDFITAHVDAERRPDVNNRYGLGGWPTIAYLSSDGTLIAQDRFLSGDELLQRLDEVQGQPSTAASAISIEEPTPSGKLDAGIVEGIVDSIYEKFDHRYGGWGTTTKFPHPEAIDFALIMVAKRNDERMREVATLTLDKMAAGPIHDEIDGGFFRFSKTPDWRSPNYEKILDANAQRLRCYLETVQLFGDEKHRQTAESIVRWMIDFMRDAETGGFYGSVDADPDYYALDAEGRGNRPRPTIDETVYTNANAMVVSSLLKASVVLDRPELREHAMRALHFLLEHLYDGDGTVYHYWDGTYHLPGMLSDQAYMIRALIDVAQHTGNSDLLLPAEAIAEKAIEQQRAPEGGFYDILHDPRSHGAMRRRNKSILENSVMAESLVRLGSLSKRPEFYDEAVRTLEVFAEDYKQYGYYVAGYGRAVDLVFYPPLTITIVGNRDSEESAKMRKAALLPYMPSRMVQTLDPTHDPILLERSGLETGNGVRAYLTVGKQQLGEVDSPEQLLQRMEEIERERRKN